MGVFATQRKGRPSGLPSHSCSYICPAVIMFRCDRSRSSTVAFTRSFTLPSLTFTWTWTGSCFTTTVCCEFLAFTADCVRLEGLKVGTGAGLTFRSLNGASAGRLSGTYRGFGAFGALPPYSCGRKALESKSNRFSQNPFSGCSDLGIISRDPV